MSGIWKPAQSAAGMAPGPRGLPVVGMLPALRRDPLAVFQRAVRDFGEVVRLPAGPIALFVLNHPDHVRHVLQDNLRNYRRTRATDRLKPFLGEGLVTSEGALWARQRALIQPAFQHQRLEGLGVPMAAAAAAMADRWETAAQGSELDIAAEMTRLTLEIIARSMFSAEIDAATVDRIGTALAVAQEWGMRRLYALTRFGERLPTPLNRRFSRAKRDLDGIVEGIIASRRTSPAGRTDLLSMLLEARDPETGQAMEPRQVRDEVMTMFLAGHETSATALAWTWYLLDRHPEAADRIAAEAAAALGDRLPEPADLPCLPYTRMVIQESMRLYPPVWRIARTAVADDEVGGFRIPAGSTVILCQYLLHRHPAAWDQPEVFDPERFAPDRAAGRPRHAWFPFAAGPHTCIGNHFALMEMQLILAVMVRRFRARLRPGHLVAFHPLLSLRPRHGLPMILERRA